MALKENLDQNYIKISKQKPSEIMKMVKCFFFTLYKIICIQLKLFFGLYLGQLYGLEKFWAFLAYYKYSKTLQVDPKLKQFLNKFKTIEDFRKAEEVTIYI